MGLAEWTISRAHGSNTALIVDSNGGAGNINVNGYIAVPPSFSLLSSITYVSGDGTQNSPIRLS